MDKPSVTASSSVNSPNKSSTKTTTLKPKICRKLLSRKVSRLRNGKIVKLIDETLFTGKLCRKTEASKLNKNKACSLKIKKVAKQEDQQVTTSTCTKKYRKPEILMMEKSVTKVKRTKIEKLNNPAHSTVTEHIQQGLQGKVKTSETKKKRNNSKSNTTKLKAAIDKTEALNNNCKCSTFEESNVDNITENHTKSKCANINTENLTIEVLNIKQDNIDSEHSDKEQKVTKPELEIKPTVAECSTADAKLQKVKKKIQQNTTMVSNIEEIHITNGTNESTTNSVVKKAPKLNEKKKKRIQKKKPISDEKLLQNFVVKIQKTKLDRNILGKLGKKESSPSRNCTNGNLSKYSSNEDINAAFICSSSGNNISDQPENNFCNYLDNNRVKHFGSNYRRKDSKIENEMSVQNAEDTQDEDADEVKQPAKKKKKVWSHSRQLDKSIIEEIGGIKKKDDEKKEKSDLIYEPFIVTDNMLIVKDAEDTKNARNRLSNIDATIDYVVKKYSTEKTEPVVISNIIEDIGENAKKTRNHLAQIDTTIDYVIKKYSMEKVTPQRHKRKNDIVMENLQKKSNNKIPHVRLENILSNKDVVQKFNIAKYTKKYESTKNDQNFSNCQSTFNCSVPSSTLTGSPLLNKSASSTSINHSEPSTATTSLSKGEFSNKNNNSNYNSFLNLRITRNVGENNAIVSLVPFSKKEEPTDKIGDNADAPLHSKPTSAVIVTALKNNPMDKKFDGADTLDNLASDSSLTSSSVEYTDSEDLEEWGWTEFYEFSEIDTVTVKAIDNIFEDAEFSFKWDREIPKNSTDLKSMPVKKPYIPVITRTIDNNYAKKEMASSITTQSSANVKPRSSSTEHLIGNENAFEDDHQEIVSSKSNGSRVGTPINFEISQHINDSSTAGINDSNTSPSSSSSQYSLMDNSSAASASSDLNTVAQNAVIKLSTNPRQTSDSHNSSNTLSKKLEFKVPYLPPAKRPPTLSKSKLSSVESKSLEAHSICSTSKIQDKIRSVAEDDDSMSIYASSIGSANFLGEQLPADDILHGLSSSIPLEEEELLLEEPAQDIPNSSPKNVETPPPVVDNELEVNCSPLLTYSHNLQNDVKKWMEKNLLTTNQIQNRVSCTPNIFKGLCHYHFTKNLCKRRSCRKIHEGKYVGNAIQNLSYKELIEAYVYTKSKCKLYIETFDFFVNAFERLKCTSDVLMEFVNDILHIEIYNKTPFIEKIVSTLCNIGVPFIDAIQEILMCGVSDKTVCLLDILLDIVCICRQENLCNNWCIVQQLIKHRIELVDSGLVDSGLVEEIMTRCYQQKNVKLAVNVVQDFVAPSVVDITAINIHTLNSFLSMLESHKVEEAQTLVTQMKLNGMLVIPPLIHNTQNLVTVEKANGNKNPNEMAIVSNKSNLEKLSEPKSSSSSDAGGVINNKVTTSTPRSNNQSELNFHDNFESVASCSKNSKDTCHSSNRNKNLNNMESQNHGEIELSYEQYDPEYTRAFSEISASKNSLSSDEDINSNVNTNENCKLKLGRNILSQDVAPCRSATSREGSTRSQHIEELNRGKVDDVESHRNIELEYTFNENANLSHSNVMNHIPVDILNQNEMLKETDLRLLKNITDRDNNLEFFMMLGKFEGTPLSRAFILNTLVYYKAKTPKSIYEMFFPIIAGLGNLERSFQKDDDLRSMVNMLAVNILGLLEDRKAYDIASVILLQFQGKYEELLGSTWFMGPHRHNYSQIGKYLYFCKILVRGNKCKQAWNILASPELRLLYGIHKWPLKHYDCFDSKLRNYVLDDLINTALDTDIQFAKDIILFIINDNNIITEIDIWKFFNQLLLKMVDNNIYMKDLTSMIENIIAGWYNYLFPSVMRGLLVRLALEIPENDALELYDKCCKRKCYPYLKGDEKILYFTTNMVETEIHMTLIAYIYKKVRNNFPLGNIILMMRSPDPIHQQPQIVSSSHDSTQDLKMKIYNILGSSLPFTVCVDCNQEERCIVIPAEQLQRNCNYYYRKLNNHQNKLLG